MNINPGKLDQRITIIDPFATVENEVGDLVSGSMTVAKVWAKVKDQGGREYVESQKIKPEARYVITIRYRRGIYEDMEVLWRDKVLKISNVFDIQTRKKFMEIQCYQKGVQR